MPLLPCPACGREVSPAATACPQCGQPIVGVVVPPPVPARGSPFAVDALKIEAAQRGGTDRTMLWLRTAVAVSGVLVILAWLFRTDPMPAPKQDVPKPAPSAADARRASAAKTLSDALRHTGVEYVDWQGKTLLVVTPRMSGDMQALADATCVALRGQGVTGTATVAVLERNAFLNGRREYLGEARCSLPP